jgi:uncharacterized membrane protein
MTSYPGEIHHDESGSLTAIIYEDEEQASDLLQAVKRLEADGFIILKDTIAAVRNQSRRYTENHLNGG